MEQKIKANHSKDTFLLAGSKLLERSSYYGIRSLIVLYMLGETIGMSSEEALNLYSWFTSAILISPILGALIGDIFIGNRKTLIAGGLLQGLGAFCFCIPSTVGLYSGIALTVIGGGLYYPNLFSQFGKLYLKKNKIRDSGFAIIYTAINIGALIGAFLISHSHTEFGWAMAFGFAGFLMLISTALIFFTEKSGTNSASNSKPLEISILFILSAIVIAGLFWGIYEIYSIGVNDIYSRFHENLNLDMPESIWQSINNSFFLPVGIIAALVWSYFFSSPLAKLTIGFLLGAISVGLLLFIPNVPSGQHLILFLLSALLLSISEIHVGPLMYSLLTKYSNPRYLAMVVSIAYFPSRFFINVTDLFHQNLSRNPNQALIIATLALAIIGIFLLVFFLITKPTEAPQTLDNTETN